MAAEQIGRRAFCIEIEPRYVDVTIRRWQRFTGKDAILEPTGQTFEEVLKVRAKSVTAIQSADVKEAKSCERRAVMREKSSEQFRQL